MDLIGPHGQKYSERVKQWARVARVVKLMDDPGVFNECPDSTVRIFRPYVGDNNRDVAHVMQVTLERLKGYRHINLYVEPINEPLPWEDRLTASFFDQIVPLLHAESLKVAGPSWSVGNPEPEVFALWTSEGFHGIDLVTLHAYWADKGYTPWAAMRPLRLVQGSGFGGPWAITEGGRDNLQSPAFNEGGQGGWMKDGVSADQYVAELIDYTRRNQVSPGFVGFTPFTGGPDDRWKFYDTDPITPQVIAAASTGKPVDPPKPDVPIDQATIVRKYNLDGMMHETSLVGIRLREHPNQELHWIVSGPPGLLVVTYTTGDGRNRRDSTMPGGAGQIFTADSKYFPQNGQHGPWTAECSGARIDGVGMEPDHDHPDVEFYLKSAPPPDGGGGSKPDVIVVAGPNGSYEVAFAFLRAYEVHFVKTGRPVGPMTYYDQWAAVPPTDRHVAQAFEFGSMVYSGNVVWWLPRNSKALEVLYEE